MKRLLWVCLLVFGLMLSWTLVYAADFYVIPVKKCCTCKGTLNGTRWCDNGDGTVTDMTTCLVWLKYADWGGEKPWRNSSTDCSSPDYTCYDDAQTRAGSLCNDTIIHVISYLPYLPIHLTDGSSEGDWRLPTKTELYNLANGKEAVRDDNMRAFTGVQSSHYWSASTCDSEERDDFTRYAWNVDMCSGYLYYSDKYNTNYVWPVRGGQ